MRWCGKRLFTLECKTVDRGLARRTRIKDRAVRLFCRAAFFWLGGIFYFVVEGRFFKGFWKKWVFLRGVFVVKLW